MISNFWNGRCFRASSLKGDLCGGNLKQSSTRYAKEFDSDIPKNGAGDGIRTHDPNLGKVMLYL